MRNVVIIPAMGESARFAVEGYAGPKALLRLRNKTGETKTMIEWILSTLPAVWCPLVVAPAQYRREFNEAIGTTICSLMFITEPTRGQTDTVLRGLTMCEGPVAVHNCDLMYPNFFELAAVGTGLTTSGADGAVAVHRSENHSMSYVDDPVWAKQFLEKPDVRPSDYAQSGAWVFREAAVLRVACAQQLQGGPNYGGEYYLSGALCNLPRGLVCLQDRPLVDWGTPDAVRRSGWEIVDAR